MLRPAEDRLDYGDSLRPPAGYTCEYAVGTTYSLDLEALLGIPLALFLTEEMDGAFLENPVYLLEGLRQSSGKFALFCEAGQIKVPGKINPVFALLEDSIHEVIPKDNRSFHPKIWIVKYIGAGQTLYRVVVMSRNLTFDRSWDIATVLEGHKTGRKTNKNRPLADFLGYLKEHAEGSQKKRKLERMREELSYIHFSTEDKNYPEFDFLPIGIGDEYNGKPTDLFDPYQELLVFSPFLSRETIEEFKKQGSDNAARKLFTRRSEVYKLTNQLLEDFDCYCLKDTIVDGEEAVSDPGSLAEYQKQDIHGKLYFRQRNGAYTIFLGSANCSQNAFGGNVEFLLRLKYRKYGFRMNDLLNELFCRTGKDDDSKNPFEKVTTIPEKIVVDKTLEDKLQKVIKAISRISSKAMVTERDGIYDVMVEFGKLPEFPDIEVLIAPLARTSYLPLIEKVALSSLSLLQLSEFYKLKAVCGDIAVERVIMIRTEGIPDERDSAVVKSVIKDTAAFLSYVSFLLSDDYLLNMIEQGELRSTNNVDWALHAYEQPVLYETMLKAASRSPHKLGDIEDMMKRINDEQIIPPAFSRLYKTFKQAVQRKGRS